MTPGGCWLSLLPSVQGEAIVSDPVLILLEIKDRQCRLLLFFLAQNELMLTFAR